MKRFVIDEELREELCDYLNGGELYQKLCNLPETVSLEGVEPAGWTWEWARMFDGMRTRVTKLENPNDDKEWEDDCKAGGCTMPEPVYSLSDLRRLVAPVQPSAKEFDYHTFVNAVEAFDWCDSDILRDIKSAMGTAKWVNGPVQPSAVVSRDAIAQCIASARREYNVSQGFKALPDYAKGETSPPLSFAADFIADKVFALQLPQPVAPVQSGGVDLTLLVEQAFIDSNAPHDYPLIQTIARRLDHLTTTQSAPGVGNVPTIDQIKRILDVHHNNAIAAERIVDLLTSRTEGK